MDLYTPSSDSGLFNLLGRLFALGRAVDAARTGSVWTKRQALDGVLDLSPEVQSALPARAAWDSAGAKSGRATDRCRWRSLAAIYQRKSAGLLNGQRAVVCGESPFGYTGHDIAHIVDGDPKKRRLSAEREWLDVWQQHKNEIALIFMSETRRQTIREDATEAFATLLAVAWTEPRYLQARGERFLEYFRRHGLLLAAPSTPQTRGDPAR